MACIHQPGIADTAAGQTHVHLLLNDHELFVPGWSYLSGGMEDRKSAFLLLGHRSGARLFILERRNDDGEWAPLPYPVPSGLNALDSASVLTALSRIGAWAQELSPTRAGLLSPQPEGTEFDDTPQTLSALLFGYRDIIGPDALD